MTTKPQCSGTTLSGARCRRPAQGEAETCTAHMVKPTVRIVGDVDSFHRSLATALRRLPETTARMENLAYARMVRRVPRDARPSHAEQGRLMAEVIRAAVEEVAA